MPDNTNVNNNAAVVVVGRTAPVPPGQQKSEKSIPVVIASDQTSIPVEEQNKVQEEIRQLVMVYGNFDSTTGYQARGEHAYKTNEYGDNPVDILLKALSLKKEQE